MIIFTQLAILLTVIVITFNSHLNKFSQFQGAKAYKILRKKF